MIMNKQDTTHRSVMTAEVIEFLNPQPGHWYVDATLGGGGHTQALLNCQAHVIAFDWDEKAIEQAKEKFSYHLEKNELILVRDTFANLDCLRNLSDSIKNSLAGFVFDFGTSTDQLMSEDRGFSFQANAPLDMRMDQRRAVKASDLIKFLSESELREILYSAGESQAKNIAKAIKKSLPETTSQLVKIIEKVKPKNQSGIHPATKTFMALRIAVNTELNEIEEALPKALELGVKDSRIICISFHDGEDKIVKRKFLEWEKADLGQNLTNKPILPGQAEVFQNRRARSAKLRVFQKG